MRLEHLLSGDVIFGLQSLGQKKERRHGHNKGPILGKPRQEAWKTECEADSSECSRLLLRSIDLTVIAVDARPGDDIKGGLAQLARAPALQAGGQRFESVILHSLTRN